MIVCVCGGGGGGGGGGGEESKKIYQDVVVATLTSLSVSMHFPVSMPFYGEVNTIKLSV